MCFAPADQYCWVPYVSLVILIASAFWSLVLQNKAMMHFDNSEVVPIYFCRQPIWAQTFDPRIARLNCYAHTWSPRGAGLFTIGGVVGAAMAYRELCWPWILLFLPGLALCMVGVFAIAYRRQLALAPPAALCPSPPPALLLAPLPSAPA